LKGEKKVKISLLRKAHKSYYSLKKSMKNIPNHQGLILVSFPNIKD
jgi:hypothetical protein